jgi:hypothetical protein
MPSAPISGYGVAVPWRKKRQRKFFKRKKIQNKNQEIFPDFKYSMDSFIEVPGQKIETFHFEII